MQQKKRVITIAAFYQILFTLIFSMGTTMLARSVGMLQQEEMAIFNFYLRFRPEQPQDDRFLIINIDQLEESTRINQDKFEQQLVNLLEEVEQKKPSVIALGTYLSSRIEVENQQINTLYQNNPNFIIARQVFNNPATLEAVFTPIPQDQKRGAFIDVVKGSDNYVRRALLKITQADQIIVPSLGLAVAQNYLSQADLSSDLSLTRRIEKLETIVDRSVGQPPGVYFLDPIEDYQLILNYRHSAQSFLHLSAQDVINEKVDPTLFENRIVLIDMVLSDSNQFLTPYRTKMSGLEIQAHLASQLISSVLDDRPLIQFCSVVLDYFWVGLWSIAISSLFIVDQYRQKKPRIGLELKVLSVFLLLTGSTYFVFLGGYWIPFIPAFVITVKSTLISSTYGYILQLKRTKTLLEQQNLIRKKTIEDTFAEIHNGPLQTLGVLVKAIENTNTSSSEAFAASLSQLNTEIREIGQYLIDHSHTNAELNNSDEFIVSAPILRLGNGSYLDLYHPLHQLFYQVYSLTLTRAFPHFSNLRIKAREFDPIDEGNLSLDLKHDLCLWLEESLCNAGKYAQGLTKLIATGKNDNGVYRLIVQDNGSGSISPQEGEGSKYSKTLARRLKGTWKRECLPNRGTICELSWRSTSRQLFPQGLPIQPI